MDRWIKKKFYCKYYFSSSHFHFILFLFLLLLEILFLSLPSVRYASGSKASSGSSRSIFSRQPSVRSIRIRLLSRISSPFSAADNVLVEIPAFAAKSCCESCISILLRLMRAPNSLRTAELLFSELIFIAYHLNKKYSACIITFLNIICNILQNSAVPALSFRVVAPSGRSDGKRKVGSRGSAFSQNYFI